jgi:gamma-glutamylaminecyclotransferase
VKLFVYGTLRRGQPGHALLRGAPLLGSARTAAAFTLIDMGEYPALLEGGHSAIIGELYEVDAALLVELDVYEDVPDLYLRVEREVAGERVFVYVLRPEHGDGRAVIASGDWLQR